MKCFFFILLVLIKVILILDKIINWLYLEIYCKWAFFFFQIWMNVMNGGIVSKFALIQWEVTSVPVLPITVLWLLNIVVLATVRFKTFLCSFIILFFLIYLMAVELCFYVSMWTKRIIIIIICNYYNKLKFNFSFNYNNLKLL